MKSFTLLSILFSLNIFAQVGINTTTPKALLDVKSSNQITPLNTDGILIPKIDAFPTINPTINQQGMMVYLTTTAGTKLPGFYYWNNATTSWNNVGSENDGWDFTGNAGTNAATQFIGTTDSQDLTFKIYNTYSGRIGAQNTSIGNQSLNPFTTGTGNSAFGIFSLYGNTTGLNNTALGQNTLFSNTTGGYNVAIGYNALQSNTAGLYNIAVGYASLFKNASGNSNNALGYNSLYNNTTGYSNNAFGYSSLYNNTSGFGNNAFGYISMINNTLGYNNNAFGYGTLNSNTTGFDNNAFGYFSLNSNTIGTNNSAFGSSNLVSNISGLGNTAMGFSSLFKNTTGNFNIALGGFSMYENISGGNNYGIGYSAMRNNTTGNYNIAIGQQAMYNNVDGNYNTFLGSATSTGASFTDATALGFGATVTASNQIRLGDIFVSSIGGQVGWSTLSDQRFKKEVKNNVPGLEFIKKLKPVTYFVDVDALENYIKTPDSLRVKNTKNLKPLTRQTGFLAQQVAQAAKEIDYEFSGVDAPKNPTDYYSLRYAEFVVPLVKAVQELESKNEILEKINKNLEDRLKKIEEMLKQ